MISYAVYFGGYGYYAKQQPYYHWSFTEKLEEAHLYKTEKQAKKRIDRAPDEYLKIKPTKVVECECIVRKIKDL